MAPVLLISYAVCFSVEILFCCLRIYFNVRDWQRGEFEKLVRDFRWETALAILCDAVLVGSCVAGLSAILVALWRRNEAYFWVDVVIMCSLQLLAGSNVRHFTDYDSDS